MLEHARSNLSGKRVIQRKSACLSGLWFRVKDGAYSVEVVYFFLYANRTKRGSARTHICKIRHISALRVQAKEYSFVERNIQMLVKRNIACGLLAGVCGTDIITQKELLSRDADKLINQINDKVSVCGRSWFL